MSESRQTSRSSSSTATSSRASFDHARGPVPRSDPAADVSLADDKAPAIVRLFGPQTTGDCDKRRREKLSLEDCVDMDVDVLTAVLERSFQSLKRETLEFFVDARTRFKSRALHELDQERRAAEKRAAVQHEELDLLKAEIKEEKQRNERLLASAHRMAEAVGAAHQRKHTYRLLLTVFDAWIAFAKSERSLKHKMHKALRYYCDEYLKRRVLVHWAEYLRELRRSNARERFEAKLAVARTAMAAQFDEKYAALERENATLKEKLKSEGEARSKLEEDMQQAFMRGVCALNMEALAVMKRGMPPGGTNPFFNMTDASLHSGKEAAELSEETAPDVVIPTGC